MNAINNTIDKDGADIIKEYESGQETAKFICGEVFNKDKDLLPNIEWYLKYIKSDDLYETFVMKKMLETGYIREKYVEYSHCILNHDFFIKLREILTNLKINKISELAGGTGWLTYWARKYGINVLECVDLKQTGYKNREFLNFVKKIDAIEYVKQNPDIELFICSWPYMCDMQEKIWSNMKSGQYLLHIGEPGNAEYCGCTATVEFYGAANPFILEKESEDLQKQFISFYGLHDHPYLYHKI